MITKLVPIALKARRLPRSIAKKAFQKLVECDLMRRRQLRGVPRQGSRRVQRSAGGLLAACSVISLHTPLGERLLRERKFDLRGARSILDVGSGAGQIARNLLKYADPSHRSPASTCRRKCCAARARA